MDTIDPILKDDDVEDFTTEAYFEENDHKIRISNGINMRELQGISGVFIQPEVPDEKHLEEQTRNYYHQEDMEKLLSFQREKEDIESDFEENLTLSENLTEFEVLKRKMKDVTVRKDGGVMKKVLREGFQTYGVVPDGATVTVHYSQALEGQDEPFDSSVLRGRPERYKLDEGRLIQGLEIGIKTMKTNEKSQFLIDYTYAYGHFGCPPRIPERAVLLVTVELIDYVEEGQAEALLAMEPEERKKKNAYPHIEKVVRLEHSNGNNYVKSKEWKMAIRHYDRGIKLLEETSLANEEEEERRQRLMFKLQLNVAHCCLMMKWPKKACIACREALQIEENNTKALYRFGKAQRMLEDYEKARYYLVRAQKNSPQDPHISEELRSLEEQLIKERKTEKTLCQNMFSVPHQEKRREEQEKIYYENFLEELEEFKAQKEKEMLMPSNFSPVEMRAFKDAGEVLGMKVVEEMDSKGSRKVRVTKI